jgi:hypothetical protein
MMRVVEDSLSLLVGAGLGLGAMYLFDPNQGHKRREALRRSAELAMRGSLDAAQEYWDSGRQHVHSAVESLGEKYNQTRAHARELARQHASVEKEPGYAQALVGVAAGTVACLAIGAGLMLLLDPRQRRRVAEKARNVSGIDKVEDRIRAGSS